LSDHYVFDPSTGTPRKLVATGDAELVESADELQIHVEVPLEVPIVRVVAYEEAGNLDLAGAETIDFVSLSTGDLVLAAWQDDDAENGIWVVNTAGAWTRSDIVLIPGMVISVSQGTLRRYDLFQIECDDNPIVLGTSLIYAYPIRADMQRNAILGDLSDVVGAGYTSGTILMADGAEYAGVALTDVAVTPIDFSAAGDILVGTGASSYAALVIGAAGSFLKSVAGLPAWAALAASDIVSGILALARGGTGSDLSATGPGYLKQSTLGASVTVATIAQDDLSDVAITGAAQGDIVRRDSTQFTNVNIPVDRLVGRLTGGDVGPLTVAQVLTLLGINIVVSDKKTILQSTPSAGKVAYATTESSTDSTRVDRLYIADGSAWKESALKQSTRSSNDMGANSNTGLLGYEEDYFTDKIAYNFALGYSSLTANGGIRVDVTTTPDKFQIRLREAWNDILYDLTTTYGDLRHAPVSEQIYVWSGNSVNMSLNKLPVVQQYQTSMGAYPYPSQVNGGTF
jgi:hypothetical protein